MVPQQVVVHGFLRPDGTLEIDERVALPPGPVSVTVASTVSAAPQEKEDTWHVLERIWAERKALGQQSHSREIIDTTINQLRDESEERLREVVEAQISARA